ncbi:hypothetical protein Hte_005699 [Hypoxylon texense]
MGASGRSPLWRENSVSSVSTVNRTKRKSTPAHAPADDDQKVEEVERRVNGLNEQLTVMQRMINGALKSQKKFQEELQVANDTSLQFNDLRQILESRNLNLQDALDEARSKIREILDRHRDEKIALEDRYRKELEAKSRELRKELDEAKAKSRDLSKHQEREKKFMKQEFLIEWESKYSKLQADLDEARRKIIEQSNRDDENKRLTEQVYGPEWESKNLKLRDELDEARVKIIELAESQLQDKDVHQEYLIEYESKTSQLRDELEEARIRTRDLIEEQLRSEKVIEEKYRTEWALQNERLRDELEEARKRILDLSSSRLEAERRALRESSRAEWQAESQGLRDGLQSVTEKLREISESQTQNVTALEDKYRTELTEKAMKLESDLDSERRKNFELLDTQLEERRGLFDKYQRDLDEARNSVETLFNGQVKLQGQMHVERQEEWKTKVSELHSQLKETEKLLQDVSDTYRAEKESHKDELRKLHGELEAVRGSKDLDIKELGIRSQETIRNLETQHTRNVEEIRKSLESEIERLQKTGEEERLAQVRKVQEESEARLREMRTALEAEISRLQWRNEQEKATQLRTIQKQYTIKMRKMRKAFDTKVARLKKTNNKKKSEQQREQEAVFEARSNLEIEIARLRHTIEAEKLSHAQKIVDHEAKADQSRLKLEAEVTGLQQVIDAKEEKLGEIRKSRSRLEEEAKDVQTKLEAESMVLRQANEAEKSRVRELQAESQLKTQRLEMALEAEGQKLGDLRVQYRDLKQAMAKQELSVTDLEHKKHTLELALDKAQHESELTKKKLASNDKRNTDLQAQLDEMQAKLDKTTVLQGNSMAEMAQSVQEKDSELAKLREERQELTNLKAKLELVEGQLNDHINTEKKLSTEVKDLYDKLEEAREELSVSTAKEAEMRKTLVTRDTEVSDLTQEVERLKHQEVVYQEALEQETARASHLEEAFDLQISEAKELSDATIEQLMEKLRREERSRRKLFHQFQKLRGTIRVICRIRPPARNETDLFEYKTGNGEFNQPASLSVRVPEAGYAGSLRSSWSDPYEFERVFLPNETNEDVFVEIGDFVQSFIDGQKACIFCYGQSGTGKTYTMSNLDAIEDREEGRDYKNDGIIPRLKNKLFAEKRRLEALGSAMEVRGCCYEIYDGSLWLLKGGRSFKKTISKTGGGVTGSELATLDAPGDFDALVEAGMRTRHFGRTDLNEHSSRSHFVISLETRVALPEEEGGGTREGLLNLVDLAGSERQHDANAEGTTKREGIDINVSLSALTRVFRDLAEGKRPTCRDNLLTSLLERSLQRDCMTLMFVMISPLREHWTRTSHILGTAITAQNAKKKEQRAERPEPRDGSNRSSTDSTPRDDDDNNGLSAAAAADTAGVLQQTAQPNGAGEITLSSRALMMLFKILLFSMFM